MTHRGRRCRRRSRSCSTRSRAPTSCLAWRAARRRKETSPRKRSPSRRQLERAADHHGHRRRRPTQDGNQPYSIASPSTGTTDRPTPCSTAVDVSATNIDDDTAGILVTPQMGLVTTEKGGIGRVHDRADVAAHGQRHRSGSTSSNTAEGTVSPASLTFTSANWNAPQTVTVKGVNDNVADGMQPYKIVTAAASSPDPLYNGINPPDVSLTQHRRRLGRHHHRPRPRGLVTTTEGGGQATFTVVLNSQPKANVTIGFLEQQDGRGDRQPGEHHLHAPPTGTRRRRSPSPASTTRSPTATSPTPSSRRPRRARTPATTAIDTLDVQSTNTDNDTRRHHGDAHHRADHDRRRRAGDVHHRAQLAADRRTSRSRSRAATRRRARSARRTSTFTPANWNVAADRDHHGRQRRRRRRQPALHHRDRGGGEHRPEYNGHQPAPTSRSRNTDNDTAGITVTPEAGLVTTEGGGQATFTVVLNSQPTANVTIALSSSKTDRRHREPSVLTFTPANWNAPQTVTVTGVDDDVADGNQPYTIVTAPATSTDANYNTMDADDVASPTPTTTRPGITVTPTAGSPRRIRRRRAASRPRSRIVLNSSRRATSRSSSQQQHRGRHDKPGVARDFTPADWNSARTSLPSPASTTPPVQDGNQPLQILTDRRPAPTRTTT